MMFVSPHLKYDPTKSLGPDIEAFCGLYADIPSDVVVATFSAGQWWVYPLASLGGDGNLILGVRLTPGQRLKNSAVVIAQGALANTLASRVAHLVPAHVLSQVGMRASSWEAFAATPTKTWKALVKLHHSFGGDDDLDELRRVLKDKRLKAAITTQSDFRKAYAVLLETQARLDPTRETATYTSYVANVIATRAAPAPAPDVGCWNEAIAKLMLYIANQESDDDDPRLVEQQWAARKIVDQLPGLDVHNNIVPSLSDAVAVRIATQAAKIATKLKDKHKDKDKTTLWKNVASAKKYDGAAHLALATTLAVKDAAASFTALMTAAFWQAQRMKDGASVDTAILDRARALARKAKWTDIAAALDEMHDVRAEMIKDGEWQ